MDHHRGTGQHLSRRPLLGLLIRYRRPPCPHGTTAESKTVTDKEETDCTGPHILVTDVAGRRPAGLDDLVGATTVTVQNHGREERLIGTGVKGDQTVLFHEKQTGSAVESEPVWTFTDHSDGAITAEPPAVD